MRISNIGLLTLYIITLTACGAISVKTNDKNPQIIEIGQSGQSTEIEDLFSKPENEAQGD